MDKIITPLILVSIMWIVFILDHIGFNFNQFGIFPRHFFGLIGIVASPFLHGNLEHIISNTFPMLVLSSVLFIFYPNIAYRVLIYSTLIGGTLVWLLAREAMHIGASGLIFALLGFIIASGIYRRNLKSILIAVVIYILYGGIIGGIFPTNPQVSFEGHLFGLIAGVFLAYQYRKSPAKDEDIETEIGNDNYI